MSSRLDRRSFFKVVGVGTAAGAAACTTRVPEKIIPHVIPPENQIPGESLWYASTCSECEAGCGILVRNREGRAVKVEGNPEHPVNAGGLCARGHSTLQATYHPDRYRAPFINGERASWEAAMEAAVSACGEGGVAVLTGATPAGSLDDVLEGFVAATGARRVTWDPFDERPRATAAELVFGRSAMPLFRFEQAGMILSLGADYLETWGNPVANQAGFASARAVDDKPMAKVVHIEPRLSATAANADEWFANRAGSELQIALALLIELIESGGAQGLSGAEQRRVSAWAGDVDAKTAAAASGLTAETLQRIAAELAAADQPIVVAGGAAVEDTNATALHAAALLLDKALGSVGSTVEVAERPRTDSASAHASGLDELLDAIDAGEVRTVILHGTDPVFTTPPAWKVRERLTKATIISLDALPTETSAEAQIVLPDTTPLESWGDSFAIDGVASIRQPAMNPIFDTRQAGDTILALQASLTGAAPHENFLDAVRERWGALHAEQASGDFDAFWQQVLTEGGYWKADRSVASPGTIADLDSLPAAKPADTSGDGELAMVVYPHIYRHDGRYANRPWLQEIPDPVIQTAWTNWVEIHPATARKAGIGHGDKVRLQTAAGSIEVFAYPTAGVAPEVVAVPLGNGHSEAIGRFGSDVPGNPFGLLSDRRDAATGAFVLGGNRVSIEKVASAERLRVAGTDTNLVTVDGAKRDLGRGIAQVVGLDEIRKLNTGEKDPHHEEHHGTQIPDGNAFYPAHEYPEHRWGMVIDTHACTGCNACVAACYSENNIPVVGKEEVMRGREMSWIHIERYYDGDEPDAGTHFVPMLCQQCGNAPCEPVCPVVATYHTVDGLNGMVYNRCVGTRYCFNNCSYKVRRFNMFGWGDPEQERYAWPDPMHLMLNPDVSVRAAGVMEKCTFCHQRIRETTEVARLDGRPVKDGEIQPACAQSCPTDAIVFGDIQDESSRASQIKAATHRGYKVLEVLNTQPAVTYLKKIRYNGDSA